MDISTSGKRIEARYRETWANISLEAIQFNIGLFRANIDPRTTIMAVVKANGYGHGAVEAANAAISAGADRLGVAIVDEALQLRAAGIRRPIIVLGYTPPSSVRIAIEHDVTITVFTDDVLKQLIVEAESLGKQARIHLKIDTGMNRIGITDPQEALFIARKANRSPFVVLEGIFTHFADADNEDPTYTMLQFQSFNETFGLLEKNGIQIPFRHCCNSAAAMRYPHMHQDMVRIGIALYGLSPFPNTQLPDYPLKPAMSLVTRICAIKRIKAGQSVGYGCTFVAARDTIIATIPIGYADGLPRRLSNKGTALLHGARVPYAGKVCMDQTMLDITDVPGASVGDEVVLFGMAGDGVNDYGGSIAIDEMASMLETISYEVVCTVGSRVSRVYCPPKVKRTPEANS